VADGQENPLALIESAKFYEVQKFCSLTNHAWDGFWFVAGGKVWKSVPADQAAQHVQARCRGVHRGSRGGVCHGVSVIPGCEGDQASGPEYFSSLAQASSPNLAFHSL
jgi:hypothetical protein